MNSVTPIGSLRLGRGRHPRHRSGDPVVGTARSAASGPGWTPPSSPASLPTPPNARRTRLCALGVEVAHRQRGRQLSKVILREMIGMARAAGYGSLVVPVRPTLKERYPLTSIERYTTWVRKDGVPSTRGFGCIPSWGGRSRRRSLDVADHRYRTPAWESWTSMSFPENGDYVFPGGLATLNVDLGRDVRVLLGTQRVGDSWRWRVIRGYSGGTVWSGAPRSCSCLNRCRPLPGGLLPPG